MGFYAAWPPALGIAVLLILVSTPIFAAADASPAGFRQFRLVPLDGLRGFLAVAVVFFHAAIYHRYLLDGHWEAPPGRFYALLGTGGVAVFFMITGYLFWSRAIDARGRPNWTRLYISRVFRIAPLYFVTILGMLMVVMAQAGWQLHVPLRQLLLQIGPWLALGILDPTDVNNHAGTLVLLAGVTWSLRYEWIFYLTLPLTTLATRHASSTVWLTAAFLAAAFVWVARGGPFVLSPGDPAFATLFALGMLSAALQKRGRKLAINDTLASCIIVALVTTLFLTCSVAYSPLALVLLGIAFHLVTSGCTVFGGLTLRASQRLGEISYGVYILQGLVLACAFQIVPLRQFALGSPLQHWAVVMIVVIALVCVAALAHVWVERPGIALGRKIALLRPRT